jgi:hypothetical protein
MLLAGPYPSHLPTFFQLLVDPEGNLWAGQRRYGTGADGRDTDGRDNAPASDMNEFFVFRADGRHLGVVELAADLRVFQIGADFILGTITDDLGVSYVHLYRIEK